MRVNQASEILDIATPELIEQPIANGLDWNFSDHVANELDGIHPYPAKFISEIPATLLDEFPRPDGLIVDPFCGSGTTLVQSQNRNFRGVGIDLNPIACLISRVKTYPLPPNAEDCLEKVIDATNIATAKVPLIPRLNHWFEEGVQKEIAALIKSIESTPNELHDVFNLALSSIIVRVSNQESDTRYAAVKKKRSEGDVPLLFKKAATRIIKILRQRNYDHPLIKVIEANTLKFDFKSLNESVAAVITSPPYPNA